MFGMAIRSGLLLDLKLSPIVWKKLVNEKVTDFDLRNDNERLFLTFENMLLYKDNGKS